MTEKQDYTKSADQWDDGSIYTEISTELNKTNTSSYLNDVTTGEYQQQAALDRKSITQVT